MGNTSIYKNNRLKEIDSIKNKLKGENKMASETTLENLTINYLTEEQYNAAKTAGTISENELYCTPDDGSSGGTSTDQNNYTVGTSHKTGETLYGVPIWKQYVEGNMAEVSQSLIILYNCKQILEANLFAYDSNIGQWFSYETIGVLAFSEVYNEVRLYTNSSNYSGAQFKGFITFIKP